MNTLLNSAARFVACLLFGFLVTTSLSAAEADARLAGDLAKAIRSGDLEAVQAAVDAGADLNALDERKMPPIGAAALLGKVDIVNYLAGKGADVNRNDGFGFTPLMCAAQRGQAGAVRALLKHGADPALKGANGSDALTYAQPKGPADPLFEEKTAVRKLLGDAIAAKAGKTEATPPKAPPPATVQPAAPANAPVAQAPAAPLRDIPLQPLEKSELVRKGADGSLGVEGKNGKPVDGIKLSTHDREEGSPGIAVAPDGSIHVVFNEMHGPPYQTAVYHRSSTDGGRTWSDAKNLSEDQADLHVGRCLIVADRADRVYVIWRSGLGRNFQAPIDPFAGGHCNLVYRVLQGGKWSRIIPIHPPGSTEDQNDGSIDFYAGLDPAGRVQVAWNTTPNKWHDELVDIRQGTGKVYRFQFNGVGNGLVMQSTLDGATATPPHEAMLTPVTGTKADVNNRPSCDGLSTLNGHFDAAGNPVFVARVTSTVKEDLRTKFRYQLFEGGKPGIFVDLPDLSFHRWRDIPTLLVDAAGRRHLIVLYPAGERPSVRDYALGNEDEPVIIRRTAGPKATLDGMQAYQGPGGRMVVVMQMNDSGESGEGDNFVSISTGDGRWSAPVNVTNNAGRRRWSATNISAVQNVATSTTCYAGPAAAAFDTQGHLLLLMVNNERGIFGSQAGLIRLVGSSSTPTMRFLRF